MDSRKPVLERLDLRGFRSFLAETVSFDNPVFLVGHNGSGKSNLVDALGFLSEAMQLPLHAVLRSRGGLPVVAHRNSDGSDPENIGLSVALRDPDANTRRVEYEFDLRPQGGGGEFEVAREKCVVEGVDGEVARFERTKSPLEPQRWPVVPEGLVPNPEPDHLALPVVGGDRRFRVAQEFLTDIQVCRVEPEAIRSPQEPEGGTRLRADGRNAASVLEEIQATAQTDKGVMRDLLKSVVPGMVDFQPKRLGAHLTIEFRQKRNESGISFPASSMSNGTLRLLGLLLAVFQRRRPSVLAIEEPELTMHPGAVGAVLDVLRHAGRFMQVVVTTHSPEVLDAKWIEDRHLRMIESEEVMSRVRSVSASTRGILRDRLMTAGELLRSNALLSDDGPLPEPPLLPVGGAQ